MSEHNESASITIAAPAAAIFAVLADPSQHARIDGSSNVVGLASGPDRLTLGSEFGMNMKMGAPYRITNKVVEFEQDRLIAWRHMGLHRWRYELEPQADGTTVVTETWDLSHYTRIGRRVLRTTYGSKTAKAITATLAKLKSAAESDVVG